MGDSAVTKTVSLLRRLGRWFEKQCDGDWEHETRVKLENLDNPGWLFVVDLTETYEHQLKFERVRIERGPGDWYDCSLEGGVFEATCGLLNLEEMLFVFLDWVESQDEVGRPGP
jgi:hypothetical protein